MIKYLDAEGLKVIAANIGKGEKGDPGEPGKSAYQSAVDGGFTDTEPNFNTQIASIGDISSVLDEINGGGTSSIVGKTGQKIIILTSGNLYTNDKVGKPFVKLSEGAWSDSPSVGDLVILCNGGSQTYAGIPDISVSYSHGDVYKIVKIEKHPSYSDIEIVEFESLPITNIAGSMIPFIVTVTISSTPDDASSIWSKNVGPWTKVGNWKIATSYNTSNLKISGMYNDDFLKISVIESVNNSTSMKEYLTTWAIAIAREDEVEINEVSAYNYLTPMHTYDGSDLYGFANIFCISGNTKGGEKCMAINYQDFKGIRGATNNTLINNKTKTTIKNVKLDLWVCKKDMMQIPS